ncbi:EAL domain-containing protein (putative c-di-GMP-specific phosphodiesterase class I) [Luteibacter rhizovicinus]|uniref:EAL domain-containing protein (Putative c-di-GMP-specific phosphodiesterase class I) n=2 Tax=Luteibacter rhizovicinus TaxID=242606 RepID=A0A4R3Z1L2_9GAMM|nr:EAL domain-containing protein (putative c-di-GMP-specific phosphodiesterase class I) [Luteibacter rhizovicinus]
MPTMPEDLILDRHVRQPSAGTPGVALARTSHVGAPPDMPEGRLELCYQPQLHLSSGRVVAVEALARWRHPRRGLLTPDRFLPAIVACGQMREFTTRVLSECFRCLDTLRDRGYGHMAVAINVSWDWIVDYGNIEEAISLVYEAGHSPDKIIIEITENARLIKNEQAIRNLDRLRNRGFTISLDDFGSGYNAIEHLRYMPLDEIKIDRSLAYRSSEDERGRQILQCLVEMIHMLGHEVTIEGISRKDDLILATHLRADTAQGNFIAHAMPVDRLLSWLDARNHGG